MSKLIKITLGLVTATALGATAQAGCPVVKTSCVTCVVTPPPPPTCVNCDGPRTGTSTLPPLSSYFGHEARCGTTQPYRVAHRPTTASYSVATAHVSASAHASASSHASASAYASSGSSQASVYASASSSASSGAHVTATAHATANAASTPAPVVTSTYQNHQYRYEGFSGNYSGLGQNERLHTTTCPVTVQNPQHRQVAGCYKVVKQWTPPQVHRPAPQQVFYRVMRPIIYVRYPVPVCVTGPCAPQPYAGSRYGS